MTIDAPPPQEQANSSSRHGILSLTIKDLSVLHSAYMPFVQNGGLFIPTKKQYKMGDEVFMILNLMNEDEKIPLSGTVIWITPNFSQSNRATGVGVQFTDSKNEAKAKIEHYLTGSIGSEKFTHTM